MAPNPYSKTLFKLALLYVLFVVPFYSTAQKIHFEGKVIDALSGDALAGASIILDQVHACTSNENGLFTLTTEPGNHQLIIYHVGYRDTLLNVPMTSDHPFITIHLIKKEEMLQEVIIGANRYGRALIEQISSISTINPKEVQFKNIQDAAQAIDQL
ncbi:MAG: carboxypeptidase-like regulatory domain-containing protein, partial [Bacteroidota bacterium]